MDRARVAHVLVGRDLFVGGVRVEPHPSLSLGQTMRLALFDPACREPLTLGAQLIRDEGPHGVEFRFVGMDTNLESRVSRMMSALPRARERGGSL